MANADGTGLRQLSESLDGPLHGSPSWSPGEKVTLHTSARAGADRTHVADVRGARQSQSPAEAEDLMRRHNPAVIPRNHHVEAALTAATSAHDLTVMTRLLDVLATPYDHGRHLPEFSTPGQGRHYRTFCGT